MKIGGTKRHANKIFLSTQEYVLLMPPWLIDDYYITYY